MTPTNRRFATLFALGSSIVGALAPSRTARADAPPQDSSFSPQLFHPAVGPDEFFTVEPARPLAHLNYNVGLWANYSYGGFVLSNVDAASNSITGTRATAIGSLLGLDAVFAIGLFDRLQVGIGVPMTLYQGGDSTTLDYEGSPFTLKTPSAFALGDPWLDVKVRLWGHDLGLNVALDGNVTAPLNQVTKKNAIDDSGNFGGDRGVTAGGKLLAGWEAKRWRAGIAIGYQWHQDWAQYLSSSIGDQLIYGAAFAYDVLANRKVTVLGELNGRAGFAKTPFGVGSCTQPSGCRDVTDIDGVPLELDVGAKLRLARALYATVGLGTGVVKGIGAPYVRGFAGLSYSPDRRDRDKDGIPDDEDKCPDQPEDRDGFKDDDGCPDPDNDGDGIPDERDRCPNEAEDFDGFQDDDGCPDPDNDKDGIPDVKDACPMDPEDHKGLKPNDGCPLDKTDSDDDGVTDDKDKCPMDPEDKDGFQDEDGCPDPDNDNDGIPDGFDKCPNEAEDMDGFQDDDGCPEPDNDGDGLLDKQDKCPNEPETLNGFQDEDGCPDKGPPLKVQVVGDEIVLFEKVRFKTGKATIEPASFNLLDQAVSILKLHPEIKKVLIEGHTDGKGSRTKNLKLSQDRANAVMGYLVAHRVAAGRLAAKGFGPDRPVAPNNTERGREANRRVQFKIVEQDKKPEAAPAPEETTPPAAEGATPSSSPPAPPASAPQATPDESPAPLAQPTQAPPPAPTARSKQKHHRSHRH